MAPSPGPPRHQTRRGHACRERDLHADRYDGLRHGDGHISLNVNKANPTVAVSPTAAPITYGSALSASKLSGGTASTPGAFTWTTPPRAHHHGLEFRGRDLHANGFDRLQHCDEHGKCYREQGHAEVTWPTASAITYGQALSNSTLTGGIANGRHLRLDQPHR